MSARASIAADLSPRDRPPRFRVEERSRAPADRDPHEADKNLIEPARRKDAEDRIAQFEQIANAKLTS
jgi:hypothetical protein